MTSSRFTRFAWATVAYLVLVVLWGAFVRATGSGAGCGSHWPLCDGVVIPSEIGAAKAIEFTHRITSGLSLLAVLWIAWRARREFPSGHLARRAAAWTFAIIIVEALLGAGLVLLEYVEHDKSVGRTLSVSLHLGNTLLLVGAATLTAFWSKFRSPRFDRSRIAGRVTPGWLYAGFALIGGTGAVTALGDTLFPSTSFAGGIVQDFTSGSHFLIQLRVIHPILALGIGGAILVWVYRRTQGSTTADAQARSLGARVGGLILANWMIGIINVIWLAPVAIQMIHLLIANLIWISLVSCVAALATRET